VHGSYFVYIPFRLFARAFLPPFVFILARKPDFLAFLILLLRAFSIVYSVTEKSLTAGSPCIPFFLVPNTGLGMIVECVGSCKPKPDFLLTAEHAESAEKREIEWPHHSYITTFLAFSARSAVKNLG